MENNILDYFFYKRDTVAVARQLLGKILVRNYNGVLFKGIISETEAYGYKNDPASHAYCGITKRNEVMFGNCGISYVYLIYGYYYCFNIVAHKNDVSAGAVLIRSVIPISGIDIMLHLRNCKLEKNLSSPAKSGKELIIFFRRLENAL